VLSHSLPQPKSSLFQHEFLRRLVANIPSQCMSTTGVSILRHPQRCRSRLLSGSRWRRVKLDHANKATTWITATSEAWYPRTYERFTIDSLILWERSLNLDAKVGCVPRDPRRGISQHAKSNQGHLDRTTEFQNFEGMCGLWMRESFEP
jgi:hypothetical protein